MLVNTVPVVQIGVRVRVLLLSFWIVEVFFYYRYGYGLRSTPNKYYPKRVTREYKCVDCRLRAGRASSLWRVYVPLGRNSRLRLKVENVYS
jgi:hypothetical protein